MIGIDKFYVNISKFIGVAKGHTEIKNFDYIIKMCRLKPYDLLLKGAQLEKISLKEKWIDEHGNSINIVDKKVNITLNDISIDNNKIINTDMYYGLSINKIINMSKILHIINARDSESNEKIYIVNLLGIDDYLRVYIYSNNEWKQYPSLYLDLTILKHIATNRKIKRLKEFKRINETLFPFITEKEVIGKYPPSKKMIEYIKENSDIVLEFIKGK